MTIYKIRDKLTKLFVNKDSDSTPKGGRVYTSIGHIKTSYRQGWKHRLDLTNYEVVEFEITEKSVTELNDLI